MLLSRVVRTLCRSRILVGTLLVLIVLYCFFSLFIHSQSDSTNADVEDELIGVHGPRKHFQWHSPSHNTVANVTEVLQLPCRNSVQGKVLLADDRGYICQRQHLLPSGCCNVEVSTTKRYACDTCQENHCCSIYEYCVSCCLHPDKKILLENVLNKATGNFRVLFLPLTDHYELCIVKCRTSSQSVQHENSYRDPRHKHCYGEFKPPLHASLH